jgi:hypothetical protein
LRKDFGAILKSSLAPGCLFECRAVLIVTQGQCDDGRHQMVLLGIDAASLFLIGKLYLGKMVTLSAQAA